MNQLELIVLDKILKDINELRFEVVELKEEIKKLHQKNDEASHNAELKKHFHL